MPKGGDADRTSGRTAVSRRRAIAGAGGIVGASLAGGIGLRLVDRAAASADVTFTAENATITTADGSIDAVTVAPEGTVIWQGLESAPKRATYELVVATAASAGSEGASGAGTIVETDRTVQGSDDLSGRTGLALEEYDILKDKHYEKQGYRGDGTAPFSASDFEAGADGETRETTVSLELTVELRGNGTDPPLVAASDETSFVVAVDNARAELGFDVTADTGIESDTAVNGTGSGNS